MDALVRTDLPLPNRREGKVRDVYDAPPEAPGSPPRIVIVATDRLSAFDVVLPTPIPGKGRLLTSVSTHWLRWIDANGLSPIYLRSTDPRDLSALSDEDRTRIEGRVTIGVRCEVVPIECVARGYLAGSGWLDYERTGRVCGVELPPGLRPGDRLPAPIFTPATKAPRGAHDENIDFDRACEIAGEPTMRILRDRTLTIYERAHAYAAERGLILCDTKFEFGRPLDTDADAPDDLLLVDEALTPDSSRYWPAERVGPGGEPPAFDKQFVRDYLLGLIAEGRWDKSPPGPELPDSIVEQTRARYDEAARRLFDENAS